MFTDNTLTRMSPGGPERLLDHREVYLATFEAVPVIPVGAPGVPGNRAVPLRPSLGRVTVILDARTGTMLEQFTEG